MASRIDTPSLQIFSVEEAKALQASKWLHVEALLNGEEMASLMHSLEEFYIYVVSCVTEVGQESISSDQFLTSYREYISAFQRGELPNESLYRHQLSSAWTVRSDHLCAVKAGEGRQLARVVKPVVQLQLHSMHYSPADNQFRSMTFGKEGISWGIQFSYPQMYKDLESEEIIQIKPGFPNHALFQAIQRWMRNNTVPTPFLIEGQKVNIPARLGKACFPWINRHPDLLRKGFTI